MTDDPLRPRVVRPADETRPLTPTEAAEALLAACGGSIDLAVAVLGAAWDRAE